MSEMIERVAAAILEEQKTNRSAFPSNLDLARAAIKVMREPTEEMIAAGLKMLPFEYPPEETYRKMIDAALGADKQPS